MAAGRKPKALAALLVALACGSSPEIAAKKTGVSVRTVYRHLAKPGFRAQVNDLRAEMARRLSAMLTAAGLGAVGTLKALQESAVSESVRLGAARAVIELGCKTRASTELADRLAALEGRLDESLSAVLADSGSQAGPLLADVIEGSADDCPEDV